MNKSGIDKFIKVTKGTLQKLNNIKSDLDVLEEKASSLRNEENSFFFDNIKESYLLISKINEYNYMSKMQDIDILINITVTLFSISLSLLIAFISVPSLVSNSIPALIVVLFSSILLIALLWYRDKLLKNLKLTYLEGMLKHLDKVTDRAGINLNYLEAKGKDIQEKLKSTKKNLNTLRKNFKKQPIKKGYKKILDLLS